jgi:hypothetical protein
MALSQFYPFWGVPLSLCDVGVHLGVSVLDMGGLGVPSARVQSPQSLKAIKRICGQERSKRSNASCGEKTLTSKKKGTKQPGTEATARVLKKLVPRNTVTFERSMGART